MKNSAPFRFIASLALLTVLGTALWAQVDESKPAPEETVEIVPKAALLTERGKQLVEELRILRRNLGSMGLKHPNRPGVEAKIEAINEQLQAWEPAYGKPSNPFRASEQAPPQMNEYDLRQLVIKLNKRVEALEKRVEILERRR
ncbi:hypothetical protein U8335_19690 [Roseiconus lacunae]|uniref:hypothetical protein n=1 Tax=Roseiconus lacunae TaxID=2605694 RepID=UPI001E42958F|nr:hypothetical protein [Roseiconus lacunae]MCD0458856.1 hypothetical protein [Roseiconus lacunae]WRQ49170.1 hypothetical protein U8335_19690 [Stieleria sp. HD01]